MKILLACALSLVVALGFSGCLQDDKMVKLNADGSGTLEETFLLGKQALAQIKQMTEGFGALAKGLGKSGGASPATTPSFKVLDEEKLRDAAANLGEGVKFVSAKPISNDTGEGYSVIYSFTDINKLKLEQNPADNLPNAVGAMKPATAKKDPIRFEFKPGSPAVLTVKLPTPKDSDLKDRPQPPANPEMAAAMMQQMFKDMKISVAVEVAGRIVETNAEYKDGSRVTLVEMDFNKVLADPVKFKALLQAQPKTIEEAKALMKGTDGMKAETQPVVTVKFQ